MTAPAVDLYHRANGQGLTYHSTTNHSVMNDALAHIDRLAGAWREAGYDVTWNGTGLIVATNDDDELRGLILFRDDDHHHLATAAAVEHVARHRNPVAALASLRAATRKDTTR